MTPVTDPALLELLEAPVSGPAPVPAAAPSAEPSRGQPVTDPALLAQLNGPPPADATSDVISQIVAGLSSGIMGTVALPQRALNLVTGGAYPAPDNMSLYRHYLGDQSPQPQTTAGRYARGVGEAIGGQAIPSAGIMAAASRIPLAASSAVPTVTSSLLRPVATAPTAATAIDLAAGVGAGLAQTGAAEMGGGPIAQTVAGLAGGIAPIVGINALARRAPEVTDTLLRRFGIHASADGGQVAAPRAQEAADQIIADQLTRAGVKPEELRMRLAEADADTRLHTSGRAQNALAPVDLDPSLQRLAGSVARQSPEAANIAGSFIRARQTGLPPPEGPYAAASVGLPTRPAYSPPITGRQARDTYGTSFNAGLRNQVPMGQQERAGDSLKRALLIKDSKSHDHASNAYRTEQKIIQQGRTEANQLYGATRASAQGYDISQSIKPVLDDIAARIASPDTGPTTARLLRRAMAEFAPKGQVVRSLDAFDEAKRAIDAVIERSARSGDTNVGRVLRGSKEQPGVLRRMLDAVDSVADNNIGPQYKTARDAFSSNARLRDIKEMAERAFAQNSDITADHFNALRNTTEQKLFRLWLHESFNRQMASKSRSADITRVFDSPRVQELLSVIIPRTQTAVRGSPRGAFGDRPERFGRLIENEQRMVATRNTVQGGSSTARNLADDDSFEVLSAVALALNKFKSNPSMWTAGNIMTEWAISKAFGMRADTAKALAQSLFNADPVQRAAMLTRISARMGPERMLRFSQIMQDVQQTAAGSIAASVPVASQAMQQRPQQ